MSTGVGGKNRDWGFPHQEPGLGITQGVYVCLYMCGPACLVCSVFTKM